MERITQEAYHRQQVIKWSEKHGVTSASNRYRTSRKTIYKWIKRYDGSIESLKDHSRAPHRKPCKQTEAEIKIVKRYGQKYRGDLLLGYEKSLTKGYTRSYGCFKRTVFKVCKTGKKAA